MPANKFRIIRFRVKFGEVRRRNLLFNHFIDETFEIIIKKAFQGNTNWLNGLFT